MIEIAGRQIAADDPLVWVVAAAILLLLILAFRGPSRTDRALAAMTRQVEGLAQGQERLAGSLRTVTDAQGQMIAHVETRLSDVQHQMAERMSDTALRSSRSLSEMNEKIGRALGQQSEKTATSLTRLQERLAVIDRAQDNITKLSGDVLGLQDILANKQTRGAFGEIQLAEIVRAALPADAFTLQATLPNGRRADCLIHLPQPPGPIAVDAKFPLEAYETFLAAEDRAAKARALKALGQAVRTHIRAIAERYILPGETAEGALMFLPSEAVYAELHGRLPDVVREGFAARVWIVSPTTCMATLTTMRAVLKDARMAREADAIRKAIGQLHRDVQLIAERAGKLDTHLGQAGSDLRDLLTATERAARRADKLEALDFAPPAPVAAHG